MLYTLIPELEPPILISPFWLTNDLSYPFLPLSNIPLFTIYIRLLLTGNVADEGFIINANFNFSLDL
jgi:hypothetical protein